MNCYIEHTNLKPYATKEDIRKLCEEAKEHHFATVCVNPCYVELAADLLKESTISVCTVIGFPLGASTTMTKAYEAISAIEAGATEIDMVINIGALKDQNYEYIQNEIEEIRDSIDGHTLKVIIETCYLTEEEIIKMTEICNQTFVHFIKTSTGFGSRGVNSHDIDLIHKHKNEVLEIEASGGIETYEIASIYTEKGVTKIGTSHSVQIMKGEL